MFLPILIPHAGRSPALQMRYMRHLLNETAEVVWRLLEIHMMKIVFLVIFGLAISDVSMPPFVVR